MDHILSHASLMYLLTENDSYAEAVKNELLYYAGNSLYDWANTSKFVRGGDSIGDWNPGFTIMEWSEPSDGPLIGPRAKSCL